MTTTARHLRPLHCTDPVIRAYVNRSVAAATTAAGDLTDLHTRIRAQADAAEKVAQLFANPRRARTVNPQVRRHELACAERMSSVAAELRRIAATLLTDNAHTW